MNTERNIEYLADRIRDMEVECEDLRKMLRSADLEIDALTRRVARLENNS